MDYPLHLVGHDDARRTHSSARAFALPILQTIWIGVLMKRGLSQSRRAGTKEETIRRDLSILPARTTLNDPWPTIT